MNCACFPKGKTPEFTKMDEIHELFVLALSLVWFAGAHPNSGVAAANQTKESEVRDLPGRSPE